MEGEKVAPHATLQVSFTPASFLAQLPSLLIGASARTRELRLCHGRPSRQHPSSSLSIAHCESHEAGVLEIVAELVSPLSVSAARSSSPSPSPVATPVADDACVDAVMRIVGDACSLNTQWCCAVQRRFSVVSLLLSTDNAEAEYGMVGIALQATSAPSIRPRWSLSRFSVDLTPLMPRMVWEREVDGVLGSTHYVVQKDVLTVTGPGQSDGNSSGGDEGAWDVQYGIRVGVLLNAAVPPPRCPGSVRTCVTERCGSEHTLLGASCVVLHAPGTSLLTFASPSQPPLPPLAALKAFTSRMLVPRVDFRGVMGAALHHRHGGSAGEVEDDDVCGLATLGTSYLLTWKPVAESSQTTEAALSSARASVHSGVRVGGRRRRLRSPAAQDAVTLHPAGRNVLFVVDVPAPAWYRILAAPETEPVAAQLAACMTNALAQLVHRNTDVFCFRAGPRCPTSVASSSSPSPPAAAVGPLYTRQVLAQSIAESLTSIIFHSTNNVFVAEAERLLFPRTATPRGADRRDDCENRHQDTHAHTSPERGAAQTARAVSPDAATTTTTTADDQLSSCRTCASDTPVVHRFTAREVHDAIKSRLL